MELQEEIL